MSTVPRSGRFGDRPPLGHHRVTIHREIDNAAELFPCQSRRRAKIHHNIAGVPVAVTRVGLNLECESREGAEDFRLGCPAGPAGWPAFDDRVRDRDGAALSIVVSELIADYDAIPCIPALTHIYAD